MPNTIHIAFELTGHGPKTAIRDGVTLETCTAEVFVRPNIQETCVSIVRGPQGHRRPRFSFFIFTCQTAREHEALTLMSREPKPSSDDDDQPTTIGWIKHSSG